MSSNLNLVSQSLTKLKTTVSVYDHPELWLKENSEQVSSALGNTSGLRPLDLGRCLFPRIVAYIHVLSKTSGPPSTINSLPIEDRWSFTDQITHLSQYQSTQNSLKNFIQDYNSNSGSSEENWETIQYLDNLSLLAHTIVVLKNYQDVRGFIEKGGSGIDAFLNLLQELLDAPYAGPARPRILRTLLDLTKRYGVYPKSLILLDVVGNSSMLMASGTFGNIYQGVYRNNVVAIKVMRIISAQDKDKLMKSFLHEAILWRQFDHPNVVPFYGIHIWTDQQSPRVCLVSPWMEHKNMIEYLVANPNADILSLMLDVAAGLQYLHNFDPTVIHGDLKGNNILIKSDSRAAVADFGLCRLIEDASIPFTLNSTSVATAGAWKYMAPELLRPSAGKAMRTTATDIYAFGCVCYEMFTGYPRFSDLAHYEENEGMMATVENRVVSRPEMCSNDLWALIKACWEVDPSSRPNISEIVQDMTANLAKRQRYGSSNSWTSLSSSLHSSTLYSQSISSLPPGLTFESHMKGDEASLFTSSDNCADLSPSSTQDGIIEGAGVLLRTQKPKILPGDQTKTLRSEDIIVALIGPSGTGKSSFVNIVMGKDVAKVGDDYESCTQQVRAYGCIHPDGSNRKVIIVDTPGFDDTYRFDFDVLKDLAQWLAKTYRKKVTLSGILQFHNIEESRMRGSSIRSLRMFQALCGENALCNVVLTTTYWDRVSSDIGASKELQLRLKFWKVFIDQGSRVARFQPRTYEAAWNLIDLFSTPLNSPNAAPKTRQPLQIQTELITEGKLLHQSAAYAFLLGSWTDLADRLKQALGSKTHGFKRARKQKKKLEYSSTPLGSLLGSGFFGVHGVHKDNPPKFDKVDKNYDPPPAIPRSQEISHLRFHGKEKIAKKTFWIAAEHALQHIQQNRSQIEAVFAVHHIEKSEYVLYAGFDESLIQAEVGYLEQIHVFSSAGIIAPSLLSQLGRIFSPFSSILFTESSTYNLPVYKNDGSTWIFDELVFKMASKLIDQGSTAAMYPTVISLSGTSGESKSSGEPSKKSGSNYQGKKGENKGKGKEEDGRGDGDDKEKNNDDDSGDPGDPDVPSGKPDSSTKLPMVLFDVVSEMFATQDGVEKLFQLLTVQGKLTIIEDCDSSHSKCDVKFVKLDFGTDRATVNTGYEQIHLRVTVDPQERDADATAIQPRQSSASDGEITCVSGSKTTWAQTSSIAARFVLALQATATVGSSRTTETSGTTEKKEYSSQIAEQVLYGAVRWGFTIDDESGRKKGIKILGLKLPHASFEFHGKSGSVNAIPATRFIDVEVTSYWSLISPDNNGLGWIARMLLQAQKNSVVYSNICQAVALKIPSNLRKHSNYKATLAVNIGDRDLQSKTAVRLNDGEIGPQIEISAADHYTSVEHGNWHNYSLLELPTLKHLRRTSGLQD